MNERGREADEDLILARARDAYKKRQQDQARRDMALVSCSMRISYLLLTTYTHILPLAFYVSVSL